MLKSLKRQAQNHRASVSVSADLCNFAKNYAILRLIDYLGNFTQKLVIGLIYVQDFKIFVIPACAGIQTKDVSAGFLLVQE